MTKSARFPDSRVPILEPRPKLCAALMVVAVIASAGDMCICVEARERTNGIDGEGDEPGLKSVAKTMARPASIIARAGAYRFEPSVYTDAGSKTGCTWPPVSG